MVSLVRPQTKEAENVALLLLTLQLPSRLPRHASDCATGGAGVINPFRYYQLACRRRHFANSRSKCLEIRKRPINLHLKNGGQ